MDQFVFFFLSFNERVRCRGRVALMEYVEIQARYAQFEMLKQLDTSIAFDTYEKVYYQANDYFEDQARGGGGVSDGYGGGGSDESVWSRLAEDFILEEILPILPLIYITFSCSATTL